VCTVLALNLISYFLFQTAESKMSTSSFITVYFPSDKSYCVLRQNDKAIKFLAFPDVLVKYKNPKGMYRGRIIGQSGMAYIYKNRIPLLLLFTYLYLFTCEVVPHGPGRASQGTSAPGCSRSRLVSSRSSPLGAA
jgi:hypothetical protein